ncbi:alpha-N-acetylgalactosaminidase-like isoform X2 [Ornithodoros turicata]
MQVADHLAEDGFRDAGYKYLIIDDCWSSRERSPDGKLQPDPARFPRGMKFLADYIHSKGLKFGMYTNYGHSTCMGFPGTVNSTLEIDANTFASWEIDYLKVDGCHTYWYEQKYGYPKFGEYLRRTGRPIVYSCSWPYYDLTISKTEPNYASIKQHCNLWRNYHDTRDSWSMINSIMAYFGDHQELLCPHAGPGHWNDPDMLMIGNFKLTDDESRAHMAIWAILAAPLIMSNDPRRIRLRAKNILLDRDVIEVDQDRLGIQGKRIYMGHGISIWTRPIEPVHGVQYSYAVAIVNHGSKRAYFNVLLKDIGLNHTSGYHLKNLFTKNNLGLHLPDDKVTEVLPASAVHFVKATIVQKDS